MVVSIEVVDTIFHFVVKRTELRKLVIKSLKSEMLNSEKGTLWEGGVKSLGFIHSPLLPKSRIGEKSFNLMHVTDWLPTLLDLAGCPDDDFGGLPLDGKSQASAIFSNVENEYSIRQERDFGPISLTYMTRYWPSKWRPQNDSKNDSRRKEVLHQMNPLIYINDGTEDPRGNWKDDHFGPLKGRCFNIARDFNILRSWLGHFWFICCSFLIPTAFEMAKSFIKVFVVQ